MARGSLLDYDIIPMEERFKSMRENAKRLDVSLCCWKRFVYRTFNNYIEKTCSKCGKEVIEDLEMMNPELNNRQPKGGLNGK